MRYIIAPLDLSTEEFEIYRLLYKSMDFETYEVKYTLNQLVEDSNSILNLSKPKVNRIIKKFMSNNLLTEIQKGNRGNPTIYKITKIDDLMKLKQNVNETQIELNRNISETNKSSKINTLEDTEKRKRNVSETQTKLKRNTNLTPINDKEKDKDNIYNKIFNSYIEASIVKHNTCTVAMKKSIDKCLKAYSIDDILLAIKRYGEMYHSGYKNCKYKWTLNELLTREKGIGYFLDEGDKWINYNKYFKNGTEGEIIDYETQKLLEERKKSMQGL